MTTLRKNKQTNKQKFTLFSISFEFCEEVIASFSSWHGSKVSPKEVWMCRKLSLADLDCMDNLAAHLPVPTTSVISPLGVASLFFTQDFSTRSLKMDVTDSLQQLLPLFHRKVAAHCFFLSFMCVSFLVILNKKYSKETHTHIQSGEGGRKS